MKRNAHLFRFALCAGALLSLLAAPALAGPREQAKLMHDRLTGVPPTDAMVTHMAGLIAADNGRQAALDAMDNPLNPSFYNSTLKNWVTPWTNEDMTSFAPLNDYTALVIGIVRDNRPFTDVLTADLMYTAPSVTPDYSQFNNLHYERIEELGLDLSDDTVLMPTTQSGLDDSELSPNDAAGVVTTRAAGVAFFSAGTNRAMWRYTALNFLCRDMEALNDVSRPADRIRQDVTRSPGGDSEIFHATCVGCHNGMDALSGAYAYFEYDEGTGRVTHTPGIVQAKNLINDNVFPGGYITVDNSWTNFWRSGQNATLGWGSTPSSGFGPKSLGAEVAGSRAFAECQVQKVFQRVCLRSPSSDEDRAALETIADNFEQNGTYSMKGVFAEVA
ncbi:MAG: hypothetical protein MJE66_13135, partial [Proteobacteria bacterium]|nr:hypothetical protein [Pseudomonadota bacterium]